jgi:hypothetical protein
VFRSFFFCEKNIPGHEVRNICKRILGVRGPEFVPPRHPQTEARDFHPLWSDFQPKVKKFQLSKFSFFQSGHKIFTIETS